MARALFEEALALAEQQIGPPLVSVLSPLYWPHLASALLLAALVVVVERGRGRSCPARSLEMSLRACLQRSSRVEYAYWFINGVLYPMLFVPWLLDDAALRGAVSGRLEGLFGARSGGGQAGPITVVGLSVAIFVAYDFGRFVGHFVQHRVPALWELHKVHHTARTLTPFTTFRMHPVELAVMATSTSLSVSAMAGVILYLFPGDESLWGELSLRVALGLFVFDLAGSTLRHTSVWLSYGPVLGRIFISPAQHQVHHSAAPQHAGKNMGFVLAIWDWLAGTLHVTGEREDLTYGSGDGDDGDYEGVLRLYFVPFARLGRRLWRAARGQTSARA